MNKEQHTDVHLRSCQSQECAETCRCNKRPLCSADASETVHHPPMSTPSDTRQQQQSSTTQQ